jgi:hypothetical protein
VLPALDKYMAGSGFKISGTTSILSSLRCNLSVSRSLDIITSWAFRDRFRGGVAAWLLS